uniref:GDNF family receptor alpha like n=1 Tax=Nothoprocta perdicaria TaxID=30464 RepID=A0A8C6Z327_NOTPE
NVANGCESVWNIVEDVCNISVLGNKCKAEGAVGCNTIIQRLADKYPVLKNCVCTTDGLCSITTLFEKECGINKANRTCLDVNKECVEDEVCNKQLSLYLKGCSVNKKCNMKECQAAIRFFYQNMPFEIAHTMAFCDCIQPDESCHRAKELLHGKPCAVTAVPTPSCLNVIHMCEENDWCRKKYKTFRSKCWRHVTKKCYDDEACLETLLKDDIPCSASPACQAAYVGTWGTVLRVGCSCHHSPASEQPLCELFQRLLHSKSCLSQLRDSNITYSRTMMSSECSVQLTRKFGVYQRRTDPILGCLCWHPECP